MSGRHLTQNPVGQISCWSSLLQRYKTSTETGLCSSLHLTILCVFWDVLSRLLEKTFMLRSSCSRIWTLDEITRLCPENRPCHCLMSALAFVHKINFVFRCAVLFSRVTSFNMYDCHVHEHADIESKIISSYRTYALVPSPHRLPIAVYKSTSFAHPTPSVSLSWSWKK